MAGIRYSTFNLGIDLVNGDIVLRKLDSEGVQESSSGTDIRHLVNLAAYQQETIQDTAPVEKNVLSDCVTEIFKFDSSGTERWQKKVGQKLFDIFFPASDAATTLGKKFRQFLEERNHVRLRVWYREGLAAADLTILLSIPWEIFFYSRDGDINNGRFLCRSSDFSIVHYLRKQKPRGSLSRTRNEMPVTTLFLSTEEDAISTFERVLDNTSLTSRRKRIIQLERWTRKTQLKDLQFAFKKYEIVQCLLHGDTSAIFVDDLGEESQFTTTEIGAMFADIQKDSIQAILLCACESANDSSAPAVRLHKLGVPVVIGFIKPMGKDQVMQFLESFSASFAEQTCSLEEALSCARAILLQQKPNREMSLDWCAPRIFLATADSDLLTRVLFEPVYKRLLETFDKEIKNVLQSLAKIVGLQPEFPDEQSILDWIKGSQRVLYLPGASGSGKSTQIAHLVSTYEPHDILLYHFCSVKAEKTTDENVNHPLVFVRDSLYPQLEKCFESEVYRSWVEPHYPYVMETAEDAMMQLVIEPLRKARRSSQWKQPILIIDGLDHAQEFEAGSSLLDLLTEYIQPLTEVLRLVITAASDHGKAHDRIRGLLKLDGPNLEISDYYKEVIELQPDTKLSLRKIKEHIDNMFGLGNKYVEILEETKSQINYQFVEFMIRIKDRALLAEIINKPPEERYLSRAYGLTSESIKNHNSDQAAIIDRLLKVLGAAYLPLPKAMLADLVETDQITDVLKKISVFVKKDDQKRVFFEHPSIKYFFMEPSLSAYTESGSDARMDLPSNSYEGHNYFLEMYRRKSGRSTWDKVDWKKLPYADYASRYLAEHAYSYYIEGSKDASWGMEEYLCLMASAGFRKFRKEKAYNTDGATTFEDIRRALRVFYVKRSIEKDRESGDFQSMEKAWNAANRAMSTVNRVQATYGRSENPLLVDLERKLCEPREGEDPYKPLYDFWASYYPSLFPRARSSSQSSDLYERKVAQAS